MMSMTNDGCQIVCDGAGCQARAEALVALHPRQNDGTPAAQPTDGWLFAASGGEWHHYCPTCLAAYLEDFSERPVRQCQVQGSANRSRRYEDTE